MFTKKTFNNPKVWHKLIHGKFILDMESMEDIREDYIFLWYKVEQKGFFFVPFVEFVTTNLEVIWW